VNIVTKRIGKYINVKDETRVASCITSLIIIIIIIGIVHLANVVLSDLIQPEC